MGDFASFLGGAAGGAVLGATSFVMTLAQLLHSTEHGRRRGWQFVSTQIISVAVFAAIGGTTAWAFTGRAGDFITGITALGLVFLIAGGSAIAPGSKTANTKKTTAE